MWLSRYRLTRPAPAFPRRSAPVRSERRRPPLTAEQLEDRTSPATITPATFADGVGIGSLRDAVLQANRNGQNNTIVLAPGTFQLSIPGRNESAGQTGDLNLTAAGFTETIQGAGAGATIVNAAQIDRVFEVLGNVTVVLSNLTVTGGLAADAGAVGGGDALGGGILNNGGNLTLDHVVVTGDTAQAAAGHNAKGGGVYSNGGSLTLTDSTVTSNSALGGAGANGSNGQTGTSGGPGGDGQGGGLYVSGGSLTITRSVIRNNQARGGAGGNGGNGQGTVPLNIIPQSFFTTAQFVTTTGGAFPVPTFTAGPPVGSTGGFTGGFTGGGFSGGFSGGSSLRAAPTAGHNGLGGMGGVGGRAQGGGLYVAGGTVHLSATTVTGNVVTGGSGGNGGSPAGPGGTGGASQGGGVFVGSGNVTLGNSSLTLNTANQSAGGAGTPGGDAPLGQAPNLFVAGGTVNTAGSTLVHKSKIGVVRPGAGGAGAVTLDAPGSGIFVPSDPSFSFGLATDQFFAGDWNGDGSGKIGVARPDGNGSLVITLDTNGDNQFDAGDQVFHFGLPGDTVIVGDWNGDGRSKIGVVRSDGRGGLLWVLDTNGDGTFDAGDQVFDFGLGGDRVVVGDWNGDGKSKIGVTRPGGNGALLWALDTNGNGTFDAGDQVFSFGAPGDHPVVGDWNAGGRDEIGVYRPAPQRNTLLFTFDANGDGTFDAGDQLAVFGTASDTVLSGKWKPLGQALSAAALPANPARGPRLTAADLAPLVNEATDLWLGTGLDPQQVQDLRNLVVRVGALPRGVVGYRRGETITLSPNAAGYGWFVDPTPADNSEFAQQTTLGLRAGEGSPAAGRMDLLTVILHEEGHALGLGDLPAAGSSDVMAETLSPGVRRLPRAGEAAPSLAAG
jgi:hypothetical protein